MAAGKKKGDLAKAFTLPKAPERSVVPEVEAAKFERARPLAQPGPGSKLRRSGGGVRVSGYVPPDVEEAFRLRCAKERCSDSYALTEALSLWLSNATAPKS